MVRRVREEGGGNIRLDITLRPVSLTSNYFQQRLRAPPGKRKYVLSIRVK